MTPINPHPYPPSRTDHSPPSYASYSIGCTPRNERTPPPHLRRQECEYFLYAVVQMYGSPPPASYFSIDSLPHHHHQQQQTAIVSEKRGRRYRDGTRDPARTSLIELTYVILHYSPTSLRAQIYAHALRHLPTTWRALHNSPAKFDWEREYQPGSLALQEAQRLTDEAVAATSATTSTTTTTT